MDRLSSRRMWMMVTMWMMLSTVMMTCNFLAITINWAIKRHGNAANIETKICSECTDLLTRGEMIQDNIPESIERMMSEENNKICCGDGKNILELANVIDQFFENRIRKVSVKELCQPEDPPAIPQGRIAGVVGFMLTQLPGFEGFQRLVWNKNNHTRISGGLQHVDLDGEVYIRKAGTYFVSIRLNLVSNSSFLGPMHEYVSIRMSVLSHELGYTRVALENRRSLWDEQTLNKPVQFGAMFNFHE